MHSIRRAVDVKACLHSHNVSASKEFEHANFLAGQAPPPLMEIDGD